MDVVTYFAPDDAAALIHATDVGKEADKFEASMRKLKIAAYDTAQSNRARETFVCPAAPFAAPCRRRAPSDAHRLSVAGL